MGDPFPYAAAAQSLPPMAVIPLTLAISLCLVFTFVVFFLREQSRHPFGSAERESLLPLSEERPRTDGTDGRRADGRGDDCGLN